MARRNEADQRADDVFRQLCHLISLDRTGKVQGAVDSLVLTVLHIDPAVGRQRDPNEVAQAISTYFGVELEVGVVRKAIETLLRSGVLAIDRSQSPPGICLSPQSRATVSVRIQEAGELESSVRQEWTQQATAVCSGIEPEALWTVLLNYLGRAFRRHGAETVQLLDAGVPGSQERGSDGLQGLLWKCIDEQGLQSRRAEVQAAVDLFFREPSHRRLKYVSQLLDGTFTFFALTVSDATTTFLREQLSSLRLFLDTNVALGLLGFQSSPQQEACTELVAYIARHKLPFTLYYHERTLRELEELAEAAAHNLRGRRYTPELSRAYVQMAEAQGGASGIELHFHRANAAHAIDVDAYLGRFRHLSELLEALPAKLYRQNAELDVEVKGEYIAEFTSYLAEYRPDRPRKYMAIDHDIVLWLSLQGQRSRNSSALRTGALLLSNDLALQGFDRRFLMHQPQGHGVPTVVLPQHLLQVLRPFDTSTPNFDERFVEVFASPEFRTVQSDYDETASRVLSYLASFDGVPTVTAVSILSDDMLMARLGKAEAASEFDEMMESAVLSENAQLVAELELARTEVSTLKADMDDLSDGVERSERQKADALARAQELEKERAQAAAEAEQERQLREGATAREAEAVESARRAKAEADLALEAMREGQQKAALVAEEAQRDARKAKLILRLLGLSVAAIVGALVIVLVPSHIDTVPTQNLGARPTAQALAVLTWIGLMYVAFGFPHRVWVFGAVVVGGVLSLLTMF